MDGLGIEFTDC